MIRVLGLLMLVFAVTAVEGWSQEATLVIFDEDDAAGAEYRDASSGFSEDGDFLRLSGPDADKLPLESGQAFSGENSGLLEWQHVAGGTWEMIVATEGFQPLDLTGFDSLVVYLNGPEAISGAELPRFGLQDANEGQTSLIWMSTPEDVRVDEAQTGFTAESPTNAVLAASYVNALPREVRRPGYPENLLITFADVPLDTSRAAIGAPAAPSHFAVTTEETGRHLDFSFRDVDGDQTLSADGEYIDVRLPEAEGAVRLRPAWRIAFDVSQTPSPLVPPGDGDVYRLALSFEAFSLDADPATWQRLSIPFSMLDPEDGFAPAQFVAVRFAHGGVNPAVRTLWVGRVIAIKNDDESFLDLVQRATFDYFWMEANPANGLIQDRSRSGSPSSIAAVGFGLSALTVGIDRGWISRDEGRERVRATLRFFWNAPQSQAPDATGYKGFFYHFLDMNTGRRAWESELSTIDTALLLGGVLHARAYFTEADSGDAEIRALADSIYARVDWQWAQARPPAISHGWRPEGGFIAFDWRGYNEAMIVYILALGSPTYPAEPDAWAAWTSTYRWETHFGYSFVVFPPLFGHQYSHVWIDFRDVQDAYMREKGLDYFENSRRATLAQRAYHVTNPRGWPNYGEDEWGLTASDVPGGYLARGAPPAQNDDGTLAPTAPGGSIAFTPDASIAALRHLFDTYPGLWGPYGFRDAFNVARNWFDADYIGIDQGPILLMIENHRTGRIWDVFMQHEAIQRGLDRAGFTAVRTDVQDEAARPRRVILDQNFPNPFRQTTQIRYSVPAPGHVTLTVYDVLGRKVATLVEGYQTAGSQIVRFEASGLSTGVYLYRLQHGSGVRTRRLLHIR